MISLSCLHCGAPFFTATPTGEQTTEELQANWKAFASAASRFCHCVGCGNRYDIEDDGDAVESGGSVQLVDMSQPVIDSINVATGPRTGGQAISITGRSLDVGTLVLKFGGTEATSVVVTSPTLATAVTPLATYTLNVAESCHKLDVTKVVGDLQLDEAITHPNGSTGTVRYLEGADFAWIFFANIVGDATDMIGTNLTGGTSGATVTVDAISLPQFIEDESVNGLTSAAFGKSRSGNRVYAPSLGFAPEELVRGATSGAMVRLTTSPAYSGLVDVTVENEYGQRLTGGTLPDAYTYA